MKLSVDTTDSIPRMRLMISQEVVPVRADELDEDVVLPGGDDDVARLAPGRDLVGDHLDLPFVLIPIIACASKPSPRGFVTPVTWSTLALQSTA